MCFFIFSLELLERKFIGGEYAEGMINKRKINSLKRKTVIYQAKSGAIELRGDFSRETIWATQAQIANIFSIERSVITKHIRNILAVKELDKSTVCAKFAHTADDGKTYDVQFYSLDVILAVGYRASSIKAIDFRKWATKTLRDHIVDGYTMNRSLMVTSAAAPLLLSGFSDAHVSSIPLVLPRKLSLLLPYS